MKNTSDYFIKKISLEKRKFKKRNQNIKLEFFRHFKGKKIANRILNLWMN